MPLVFTEKPTDIETLTQGNRIFLLILQAFSLNKSASQNKEYLQKVGYLRKSSIASTHCQKVLNPLTALLTELHLTEHK